MTPHLSIIIPCYNCASTLREAVSSCYTQGFSSEDFEVVMVNDCSTDETATTMADLASEHSNIRIHNHAENRGGGAARNTAVTHARAAVIFCLDSDDLLPPGTLKKMFEYLQQKGCDGVCFQHSIKFRGTDITNVSHTDSYEPSDTPVELSTLIMKSGPPSPVTVVFMFTKRAWHTVQGYPTHHGFDTQGFGWRFLSAGLKAYICPGTTYLHRVELHQSYYLREWNAGKTNLNMREILFEHLPLFSPPAQQVIRDFAYEDFTKDIFGSLLKLDPLFSNDKGESVGTLSYTNTPRTPKITVVPRNSLRGLWFRFKSRIRNQMT
ncbi:glycosyltransferase [Patescibacteria group bacterium]|nr:glycosyltransferase [Patescibacteria group bacterium]